MIHLPKGWHLNISFELSCFEAVPTNAFAWLTSLARPVRFQPGNKSYRILKPSCSCLSFLPTGSQFTYILGKSTRQILVNPHCIKLKLNGA